MIQDIGRNEFDNGYLSDVPGPSSVASSEGPPRIPTYLVHPHEMEKDYKQKYTILKDAYEQRIKQISLAIEGGLMNFLTDEILGSLTEHGISAAYIHQHLAEVFDDHMKNDREKQIHESTERYALLESDLRSANDTNAVNNSKIQKMTAEIQRLKRELLIIETMKTTQKNLEDKCARLETQFENDKIELMKQNELMQEQNSKTTQQLVASMEQNDTFEKELHHYRQEVLVKTREVSRLEQTMDETTHHLEILAREEAEDKNLIPQLQAQLLNMSKKLESVTKDNFELKYKVRQYAEDYARIKNENAGLLSEQEANKSKTALLMTQVEDIIAQETSESNATIGAIHKKMKDLRAKLAVDLQKEVRISAALREEVLELKSAKESTKFQLQQISDDATKYKQQFEFEYQRTALLQKQLVELQNSTADAKNIAADANTRMILAEKKLEAMQKLKKEEMRIVEANAFMQAEKKVEAHHDHLEARELAHKLKHQNDYLIMHNQLRHSYSAGDQFSGMSPHPSNFFDRIGGMTTNQDIINESLIAGKDFEHQRDTERLQREMEIEHNQTIHQLQLKLDEAMGNIDKLKRLFQDQRSANVSLETQLLNEQQMRLQLDNEMYNMRQRMLTGEEDLRSSGSVHKSMDRSSARELLQSRDHGSGNGGGWDRNVHQGHSHNSDMDNRHANVSMNTSVDGPLIRNDQNHALRHGNSSNSSNNGLDNTSRQFNNRYASDQTDYSLNLNGSHHGHVGHGWMQHQQRNQPEVFSRSMDQVSTQEYQACQQELQHAKHQIVELETANGVLQKMLTDMEQRYNHDQHNDSMALDDMRGKFESLMMNFGQSEDKIKEVVDQHEISMLQKEQTIAMLQQNLAHVTNVGGNNDEELRHVLKEFKMLHEKWKHSRQVLLSMESLYHKHIRTLQSSLRQVRNASDNMMAEFTIEKDRICRETLLMCEHTLNMKDQYHADEMRKLRMNLVAQHDSSQKKLEDAFNRAMQEKTKQFDIDLNQAKSSLVQKINQLSDSSTMSIIQPPQSQSITHESTNSESARVTHLNLVIRGLLEGLVSAQVVPNSLTKEIHLLMIPGHVDTTGSESIGVSANVCLLVRGHLTNYVNQLNTVTHSLETSNRELHVEIERRKFAENSLSELQHAVGSGGGNMVASPLFSSPNAQSRANANGKSEENLLNELLQLEYKSQIKVLQDRMEEVQLTYKAEIQRLEMSSHDRETALKRNLEAKYTSLLTSDKQLVLELETQLINEQNKRKQLQLRLNEEEKSFRAVIDELEKRNRELQTRAEKAELMVSKLKINNSTYL